MLQWVQEAEYQVDKWSVLEIITVTNVTVTVSECSNYIMFGCTHFSKDTAFAVCKF